MPQTATPAPAPTSHLPEAMSPSPQASIPQTPHTNHPPQPQAGSSSPIGVVEGDENYPYVTRIVKDFLIGEQIGE